MWVSAEVCTAVGRTGASGSSSSIPAVMQRCGGLTGPQTRLTQRVGAGSEKGVPFALFIDGATTLTNSSGSSGCKSTRAVGAPLLDVRAAGCWPGRRLRERCARAGCSCGFAQRTLVSVTMMIPDGLAGVTIL